MAYHLQATCCQREYKDKHKRKHQSSYGKLACQVYSAKNVNFGCKTPSQAFWKHV